MNLVRIHAYPEFCASSLGYVIHSACQFYYFVSIFLDSMSITVFGCQKFSLHNVLFFHNMKMKAGKHTILTENCDV